MKLADLTPLFVFQAKSRTDKKQTKNNNYILVKDIRREFYISKFREKGSNKG